MTSNNINVVIIGLLLIMIVAVIGCGKEPAPPTAITNNNLSVPPAETADNPLAKALVSGMPVVADFGRGTCIPCKAMKPILEELMQTYKGRAVIFIFDTGEYKELTKQYGINLIPTQIFFDKTGKEVWRHEGFLEKEKITGKLTELGVK